MGRSDAKQAQGEKRILPVMEEKLQVERQTVETGTTVVSIKVDNVDEVIQQPLARDSVDIRHVAVGRFVDQPLEVRSEGDVIIIPVLEEVLVWEKKLRLKEEIHIRRHREVKTHTHREVLRKEEAVVEHRERPH